MCRGVGNATAGPGVPQYNLHQSNFLRPRPFTFRSCERDLTVNLAVVGERVDVVVGRDPLESPSSVATSANDAVRL